MVHRTVALPLVGCTDAQQAETTLDCDNGIR
jgi:hypothetical protein